MNSSLLLWATVADYGGGMSASCKPRVPLFVDVRAMNDRIVRCGIIG